MMCDGRSRAMGMSALPPLRAQRAISTHAPRISGRRISNRHMHPEILEPKTTAAFTLLGAQPLMHIEKGVYLVGGTALALQFGHRESVDLDFVCEQGFPTNFRETLSSLGIVTVVRDEENTFDGTFNDVKISMFAFRYPRLFPTLAYEGIALADARDIAAMKILAVTQRAARKDFVDLYMLIKQYGLPMLLDLFERKYAGATFSRTHLLKSISYFADAEADPMPRMHVSLNWEEIKQTLEKEAHAMITASRAN